MLARLRDRFGLEDCAGDDDNNATQYRSAKDELKVLLVNASLVRQDGIGARIPGSEFVLIGSLGSAYNLQELQNAKVTHILCLSSIIRCLYPDQFVYKRVAMQDKPDFNLAEVVHDCLQFIDQCRAVSGNVLVHCYQGISRSAAICVAFLIRERHLSVAEALAVLRTVRPIASPNRGFLATLEEMSEKEQQQLLRTVQRDEIQ